MFELFSIDEHPGRAFVLATVLPLVPVFLLLISALVRNLTRSAKHQPSLQSRLYWLLGGDQPLKSGGYLSIAFLLVSVALSGWAAQQYFAEHSAEADTLPAVPERWSERMEWLRIGWDVNEQPALRLELGYHIDGLNSLMFVMVSCIATLIFLFTLGYMQDETQEDYQDHVTHTHRRGRFGRFYLYLNLFVFSMLNLLLADNLFQIFISWELVGVCSFFLIGFYYERKTASIAANKAFIVNRVGDAGFLIGIAVAFSTVGTLDIQDLVKAIDTPLSHGLTATLITILGLGIFLGCVGKSAQVPLQTWLPDAMEGPTPVSALIHAATMVAAGVYLVGRCFPLFSADVLLIIAYCGLFTLFLSAMIALVMTDIKRVLAFSTCSQLGYMMLALGVGAWTAGLLHLLTHAFFKALLFLGAGSVIHGIHHEQDLRKMGGLRKKMPITAYTMLIGVLAISGVPFLSGWYSKDQILAGALGFSAAHPSHFLLFLGPWLTAGFTAFYMFRLWYLTFAGEPRDAKVYDYAHESPWVMTLPLVLLACCSIGIAWGWPLWNAEASALGHLLHQAEPSAVHAQFAEVQHAVEKYHWWAAGLGLLAAVVGIVSAWQKYGRTAPSLQQLQEPKGILAERWYFDRFYDWALVRSTIALARGAAATDRVNDPSTSGQVRRTLDGTLNGIATAVMNIGERLRQSQTGFIRNYVFVVILTTAGLLALITFWNG